MKLRNSRFLVAVAVALSASMIFTVSSFAISRSEVVRPEVVRPEVARPEVARQEVGRPQPSGSGCVGLECYGAGNGGYGNHLPGTSGTGSLAGYSRVRFDGYRPEPGLTVCTQEDAADRRALSSLGLLGSTAPRYWHRRVAILRSDNVTATNGVQDAKYWDQVPLVEFNLNTGATRPATAPLDRAPTHASPWIGPRWLGNQVCLPLAGGVDILTELQNKEPVISVVYKGNEVSKIGSQTFASFHSGMTKAEFEEQARLDMGRVFLRMDDLALRVVIEESSISSGAIPIDFEFLSDQVNVNVGSLEKFFDWLDNGADPENARDIWVNAKDKTSPIYADFKKAADSGPVSSTTDASGTTTSTYLVPLKVKKKGIFSIQIDANYQAYVGGNNGTTLPFTGLSGTSNALWVNAVSVKSVNR